MTLEDAIKEILTNFKSGEYFDSHTVINALLKNPGYYLAYLHGYSNTMDVLQYHRKIGHIINDSGVVKKTGTAISHTIYGNLSDNALWKKM
jgi:hypothetical protein